jgi:OTU domain-containing protein 6
VVSIGKGPTRAQKRREQRAADQAKRDERIARELAELGESSREIEEEKLAEQLKPEGLMMHPVQVNCSDTSVGSSK